MTLRRIKKNWLTDGFLVGHARIMPSRRQIWPRDFDSGFKRTNAKVNAVLFGNENKDQWNLPPKPKEMRWVTYKRWVARYDPAEEMLYAQLAVAAAGLMKRL